VELCAEELQALRVLEESLWCAESRFDENRMAEILAPDFFEFGRSGRAYTREDIIRSSRQDIPSVLPLIDFQARLLANDVAQVTYISHVHYQHGEERAIRSSIWSRRSDGSWKLRFHQGTPMPLSRSE
jgi:hypothetical protein